jgi:hypothetical protein
MKFYTAVLIGILEDLMMALFQNLYWNRKLTPYGATAPPGKIAPKFLFPNMQHAYFLKALLLCDQKKDFIFNLIRIY